MLTSTGEEKQIAQNEQKSLTSLNETLASVSVSSKSYDGMMTLGNRSYRTKSSDGKLAVEAVKSGEEAKHLAEVKWRVVEAVRPSDLEGERTEEELQQRLVESRRVRFDGDGQTYNDMQEELGPDLRDLSKKIVYGAQGVTEGRSQKLREKVDKQYDEAKGKVDKFNSALEAYKILPVQPKGQQDPAYAWLKAQDRTQYTFTKWILFTAAGTPVGNMGQSNYCSGNMYLEAITFQARQDRATSIEPVAAMMGAIGGIGMRWKAFASQDFLAMAEGALFTLDESVEIMEAMIHTLNSPEYYGSQTVPNLWGMNGGAGWPPQKSKEGRDQDPDLSSIVPDPLGVFQLAVSTDDSVLVEGARVRLKGLQSNASMNGRFGTLVQKEDEGKWRVELDGVLGDKLLQSDNLELLRPVAKQSPLTPKPPAKIYCIAGSWDDWVPHDMTWDWGRQCFTHRVELGELCKETFQINSGKAPDAKWITKGQDFTIGARERCVAGDIYEVRMFLKESGACKKVDWIKVNVE